MLFLMYLPVPVTRILAWTILPQHQEDDILVSGFSHVFAGFQVSRNLETRKPGNLHGTTSNGVMYIKDEEKK
jgi:hypothetical protein